jgi:hypothetical protein
VERRLDALLKKVEEVSAAQQNMGSDTDALSTRVGVLDELFSRLEGKRGAQEPSGPAAAAPGASPVPPPAAGERRITGDELAQAIREMPQDGREMLRKAIREEIDRVRQEQKPRWETEEELAQKAQASVKSLTATLSLTPVQVEQARDLVARQVENILELKKQAEETGDYDSANKAREQLRREAEKELVDMLTPAQLDKLRELDPEGFGKRYPRGF